MTGHEQHSGDQPQDIAQEEAPVSHTAEQPVFEYDADHLPALSAEQMDDIETKAREEADSGVQPEEVQAHVYEALTELGFDLSTVQQDSLPIRFTGLDGKEDIRVVTLDYRDFGTRIKRATLHEAAHPTQEVETEQQPESAETEDGEQKAIVDSLMDHLDTQVARMDLSSEDDKYLRGKLWHQVSDMLGGVRNVTRDLSDGRQLDSITLRQFENKVMGEVVPALMARASKTEEDRVRVRRLEEVFAEVKHETTQKLDSTHAEMVDATLRHAETVRVELGANRTREDAATHRAGEICAQIGRVIGEMSTSRYGYESYNARLRQLSAELEQEITRHGSSESQLRQLTTELRGVFDTDNK